MKTNKFDCLAMKRRGGRKVYEHIKDMTPSQELAFWRKRTAGLERQIRAAKRASPSPPRKL